MSYLGITVPALRRTAGSQEHVMDAAELKVLLMSVTRLTPCQMTELMSALAAGGREREVLALVESRLADETACPHCKSAHVVRNGSASGQQRYMCRGCLRTFNALSTTPLSTLRMKSTWLQQQDVLLQGLSVNKAAAALEMASTTAFRWRHRFLQRAQSAKAPYLTGVDEADETFFLRSSKCQRPGRKSLKRGGRATRKDRGMDLIPILVVRARSGTTADFLLEAVSKACVCEALKPRILSDAILCTDGSVATAAAAMDVGVQHEALNLSAGERVRGPWHIQNVNAYRGGLKKWIARFKVVSTDYLESYPGWFRALERASKRRMQSVPMLALALGVGGSSLTND